MFLFSFFDEECEETDTIGENIEHNVYLTKIYFFRTK